MYLREFTSTGKSENDKGGMEILIAINPVSTDE